MAEPFLLRTKGGPHPGDRLAEDWSWPLPEALSDTGGRYIKVSESLLPPQPEGSNAIRGAVYEWEPDNG
jgi:hypothetical protein